MVEVNENCTQKTNNLKELLGEVMDGTVKCDILPNAAYEFVGNILAEYSAKTDIFRNTVMANMIMNNHQDDVTELKNWLGKRA